MRLTDWVLDIESTLLSLNIGHISVSLEHWGNLISYTTWRIHYWAFDINFTSLSLKHWGFLIESITSTLSQEYCGNLINISALRGLKEEQMNMTRSSSDDQINNKWSSCSSSNLSSKWSSSFIHSSSLLPRVGFTFTLFVWMLVLVIKVVLKLVHIYNIDRFC